MKQKSKSESTTWLVVIGIVLMIVIAMYFIFRSEKIKQYKEDLEHEIRALKAKIREKEENVQFLTVQLNNLKQIKDYLIGYAKKLFIAFKLIVLVILIGVTALIYAFFNFDIIGFTSFLFTIISGCYYLVTVIIKNRVGDINRTLKLLQDGFISFVFNLKDFDDSLIAAVEAKLLKELDELNELRQKCLSYELKTVTVSV
jgi:hypothetical protein